MKKIDLIWKIRKNKLMKNNEFYKLYNKHEYNTTLNTTYTKIDGKMGVIYGL
jgi:hypothetical protein